MKHFKVTIKERGAKHTLHTTFSGSDTTTKADVEAWYGLHESDVEHFEIVETDSE